MSKTSDHQNSAGSPEEKPEELKTGGGPYAMLFPPEALVWNEARKLVADKNSRVENLAACISQDPVIAMELLRVSNAMYFSGGKAPITTLKTAIVRLGAEVVQEHLENLKARPTIQNEDVSHWFELYRAKAKRNALTAKIISEAIARNLSDDCEAAALFSCVGEMLAVAYLGQDYVALAEEHSRSGVNYRLAQDHKFDVEKMGLTYLRRHGIPEALIFSIDRDGRSRTPDRTIMKPICAAAIEMVEAFDSNRWEKLAPGKNLPPKSAVRMLGVSEGQYLKIYERVSEYLFNLRQRDESLKKQAVLTNLESPAPVKEENELQNEIDELISSEESADIDLPAKDQAEQPSSAMSKTIIAKSTEPQAARNELFALKSKSAGQKSTPRVSNPQATPVQPPVMRTAGGNKMMSSVTNIIETAQSSEELLQTLLQMLVDNGPFEKSALIVVSRDRKHAIVVAARGPSIGNGQKLELDDPLSPLAQCFSKVQSFGNKGNANSPWGSKAFALAPIDADHETPVALYADCGNDGSLSFEARRVFRNVVDILNQKLPEIPGGIPVEI